MNAIIAERGAASRLRQASALMRQIRVERDEPVRSASQELTLIYDTLADRILAGVAVWERFAKTKTADDVAALVPEAATHIADVEEAWRLLPFGVGAVTEALVDTGRLTQGRFYHLRITHGERAALVSEITRTFPNVKAGEKGGQVIDVSVNLFREFFNSDWRYADDK